MKFPIKEEEVVALAQSMVAGYTAHAGDFPSATVASVTMALDQYLAGRNTQTNAKSQAAIATETKDTLLDSLVDLMKSELKLSEVDTRFNPEKLTEIGWGPRQEPTPIVAPGSPTDLRAAAEGTGEIWLNWERPATETGGMVRNYIIERADEKQDHTFGPWLVVQSTYNVEAHLLEQPSNQRLIYRVKASNAGGESAPSNTLFVLLP